jgi:hypothetical protein
LFSIFSISAFQYPGEVLVENKKMMQSALGQTARKPAADCIAFP